MPLSPEDAAQALKDVERTQHLTIELRGYEHAAPHFMIWGLVWAFGYALTDAFPDNRNLIWGIGVVIGTVSSILLGRRGNSANARFDWRWIAVAATIAAFFTASSAIMAPLHPRQIDAFIPLVFAVVYIVTGLWLGLRFTLCGVVLGAMTVLGFFVSGDFFGLWMAVVGGGVLLLTGFWLRTA
jgi:hypothetical protein